jgi:prevent-host-death family protein
MGEYTAEEAKEQLNDLLSEAQHEPVYIMKHNRCLAVIISTQQYDMIETLLHKIKEVAENATPEEWKQALNDTKGMCGDVDTMDRMKKIRKEFDRDH